MQRRPFLLALLLPILTLAAESDRRAKAITIDEALGLAVEAVPEGTEIFSIEKLSVKPGLYAFFAVYGERILPYKARELQPDGTYQSETRYRRMKIGFLIGMDGVLKADVQEAAIRRYREVELTGPLADPERTGRRLIRREVSISSEPTPGPHPETESDDAAAGDASVESSEE